MDSEDKLRRTEILYNLIANNASDVIWTMDLDGHFTYVSPSVFQLRGYTPEEAMQQSITESLTPKSAQLIAGALQKFHINGSLPSSSYLSWSKLERTALLFG